MKSVNYIVLLFSLAFSASQAAEGPVDNFQFMKSALQEALKDKWDAIQFTNANILLESQSNDETNWLYQNALIDYLEKRSAGAIFIHADSCAGKCDFYVKYAPLSARIVYKKLPGKRIERSTRLAFKYTIAKKDGRVLAADVMQTTKSDTLKKADLNALELENFNITKGTMQQSVLGKALQPALVSIITGFTIYLFYSYRSR